MVGYLTEAPKIVRDVQPMQWQFLDPPADGRLMLVWQPLEYLGTNFASDGYIWGDAEHAFKSEVRGFVRCGAPALTTVTPLTLPDLRNVRPPLWISSF